MHLHVDCAIAAFPCSIHVATAGVLSTKRSTTCNWYESALPRVTLRFFLTSCWQGLLSCPRAQGDRLDLPLLQAAQEVHVPGTVL